MCQSDVCPGDRGRGAAVEIGLSTPWGQGLPGP